VYREAPLREVRFKKTEILQVVDTFEVSYTF
jgi:hypothetical protein